MKNSIMATFAAIFLGAVCVGFAACGAGGPDAVVEGVEVTEEQWNAAFAYLSQDDAEYSVEFVHTERSEKSDGDKFVIGTSTGSIRVKGGKAYYKKELKFSGNGIGEGDEYIMSSEQAQKWEKDNSAEQYNANEDGAIYFYDKNDAGKWEKEQGLSGYGFSIVEQLTSLFDHDPFSYDHYEYNTEKKCYVLKSSITNGASVIKFGKVGNDVRLLEISVDATSTGSGASYIFSYTDVADIVLPEVTAPEGAKDVESIEVTEDEWNAAFEYIYDRDDAEYAIEFSMYETVKTNNQSVKVTSTVVGCVKGGKAYVKQTMQSSGMTDLVTEQYGANEDGTCYVYSKNNGGAWEKNPSSTFNIAGSSLRGLIDSDLYSSYEYSAEDKGYIVTPPSENSPKTVLKFGKVGGDVRLVAVYLYGEGIDSGGEGIVVSKEEANAVFTYTDVADITLPPVD